MHERVQASAKENTKEPAQRQDKLPKSLLLTRD